MRYTEGKETKNKPKSQAISASMRWAKSAYSSFLAICKIDSFSSVRSLCTDSVGPGLRFRRFLPLFFFLSHLTKHRQLIFQKIQLGLTERPASFFFPGFLTPLLDQPRLFLFLSTPVSAPHNPPKAQLCALPRADQSNLQEHLHSRAYEYESDRWNRCLHVLKFLQLAFYRFVLLKITDNWYFFLGDKKRLFFFSSVKLFSEKTVLKLAWRTSILKMTALH